MKGNRGGGNGVGMAGNGGGGGSPLPLCRGCGAVREASQGIINVNR